MTATKVIRRNANVANINSGIAEEVLFFSGDSENEDFVMDISAENTSAILNELTDLSSNPGAYAIREAYSNAYDAVVATGDMTRPIEVTVPQVSEFNEDSLAYKLHISECPVELVRYATVTDHGIGMTTEDLRKFFTQYGGTKKQGAGLIGSKGLGSKAPLACADFFDVITTKDGVRSAAHLWRGNGHNYAKIVKVEQTDEGDGTTVRIPIVDPKIATEMHECMSEIAKWNLDASLTYNGERFSSFLNDGISEDGKRGYIFLGNVKIGVDEDGQDVRVRMWQGVDTFPHRLYGHPRYGSTAINWSFRVDLNLCGVRYPLTDGGYSRSPRPDIVVAGDPGYLNFTPSRDEVKDDDAKRTFLEAISEASYDIDAISDSLFGRNGYGTVARLMMEHYGYIDEGATSDELSFAGSVIGAVNMGEVTTFAGVDMADYLALRHDRHLVPASGTRYHAITKLSGRGYLRPVLATFSDGVMEQSNGAYGSFNKVDTARDIAAGMRVLAPLPLVAIVPSPMLAALSTRNGGWACRSILNDGDNHAVVITGEHPAWTEFQSRETGIRKLIAGRTSQDMKDMTCTYLFADGTPTEQDMMALEVFSHVTVTTWDELVSEVRAMNRANGSARKASAPKVVHVGAHRAITYDLTGRVTPHNRFVAYESPIDALLGDPSKATAERIDFDSADLSEYVFAIGDGGSPEAIAHIASAMAMAGLLGDAKKLSFVSTTASSTTSYPLNMNEVKALVKTRGMRIFGDFRMNRSHVPGIIDDHDGIAAKVVGGHGYYRVQSKIDFHALGIDDPTFYALAHVLRHDLSFRYICKFVLNCRSILGTTFCDVLDDVLAAKPNPWWEGAQTAIYRRYHNDMELVMPDGWDKPVGTIKGAIGVFEEISRINGVQSLIDEASGTDGALAKDLITVGLQSIVKSRIS